LQWSLPHASIVHLTEEFLQLELLSTHGPDSVSYGRGLHCRQQRSQPPRLLLRVPIRDESDILLICPAYATWLSSARGMSSKRTVLRLFYRAHFLRRGDRLSISPFRARAARPCTLIEGSARIPYIQFPLLFNISPHQWARRLSLPLGYGVTRCRPWLSLMVRNGVSTKSRYGSKDERGHWELFQ
jgi:hypothetical protein